MGEIKKFGSLQNSYKFATLKYLTRLRMGTKFSTRIWVSVVGIASIFFGSKGYADTVISVADFGLKPDTRENAVAYVQKR